MTAFHVSIASTMNKDCKNTVYAGREENRREDDEKELASEKWHHVRVYFCSWGQRATYDEAMNAFKGRERYLLALNARKAYPTTSRPVPTAKGTKYQVRYRLT